MKTIILIILYTLSISFTIKSQPKNLASDKVKSLLEEINFARSNPKQYAIIQHLDSIRLDTIPSTKPFKLNYNLCKMANNYAEHLSKAKYNHNSVSCKHSDLGLNESINFCITLEECVSKLIIDKSDSSKGHRKHLLGIDNNDSKIGIGIAYIPDLEWYVVVIITEK